MGKGESPRAKTRKETIAAEEAAGGARKATKSKLFEFLVNGVVSERSYKELKPPSKHV